MANSCTEDRPAWPGLRYRNDSIDFRGAPANDETRSEESTLVRRQSRRQTDRVHLDQRRTASSLVVAWSRKWCKFLFLICRIRGASTGRNSPPVGRRFVRSHIRQLVGRPFGPLRVYGPQFGRSRSLRHSPLCSR